MGATGRPLCAPPTQVGQGMLDREERTPEVHIEHLVPPLDGGLAPRSP